MNPSTKPFWDINEDHIIKDNVRVRNINAGINEAVEDIKHLESLMNCIKKYAQTEYNQNNFLTPYEKSGIKLFLDTPHVIMESSPYETKFTAINKPKNVTKTSNSPHGTDKQFRASHKHVMFKLRSTQGKRIYNNESLTIIFAHEISHTMANHVKWRYDDHNEDFKIYQRLITKWLILLGFLNNYKYL
jgi:hypothetical protein